MGGTRIIGPTGRDQAYVSRGEPTFRKGNGAKGNNKAVDTGAGVGSRFLSEVAGGSGGGAVSRSGGTGQVPSGPPPLLRGIRRFLPCGRWLNFWKPEVGCTG